MDLEFYEMLFFNVWEIFVLFLSVSTMNDNNVS